MIRVVQLLDALYDGTGGAERFACGLARGLPADRFEVTVCATRQVEGQLPRELEEAGVRVLALNRRGTLDLPAFGTLARRLRSDRVDVLHAHKFGSNVWGTLLGRACRVPVVVAHEHTWSYEGQRLRVFLDGQVIGRLATRFVAVSALDRERMIEVEGVDPAKAIAIPTGYIPRPRQPGPVDPREELGLPVEAPVIGTVANLRPQKRLDVLIDAFGRLGEQFPALQLVIVGDGPSLPDLKRQAEAAGLAGRVHFPGVREDLEAVFAALHVAVMSSDFEGMPLFVFEAMAHHTPFVSTAVGGIPDVVEDGRTGLLVPPGEPAALAEAIGALLSDPERAASLASGAAERLEEFSLDAIAGRFADLYDQLLAERRGGA